MDLSTWLLVLTFALVTALTPGPGVLLAVSNAVEGGIRAAMLCSLGNAIGLFFVSGATMIGLGALLKSSAILFAVLKILGAGYLVHLGIRQWRSQISVFVQSTPTAREQRSSNTQLILQGLLLAPTNPKSILFFAALLPQFINLDRPILTQFLIVTTTFATSTIVSHMMYGFLAHHAKCWFSTHRRAMIFNRVSGGAFMLLGANMFRLKSNPS